MPMSEEVYMFFYRKDLFQQAGIDADSIKTMESGMRRSTSCSSRPAPTRPAFAAAGSASSTSSTAW